MHIWAVCELPQNANTISTSRLVVTKLNFFGQNKYNNYVWPLFAGSRDTHQADNKINICVCKPDTSLTENWFQKSRLRRHYHTDLIVIYDTKFLQIQIIHVFSQNFNTKNIFLNLKCKISKNKLKPNGSFTFWLTLGILCRQALKNSNRRNIVGRYFHRHTCSRKPLLPPATIHLLVYQLTYKIYCGASKHNIKLTYCIIHQIFKCISRTFFSPQKQIYMI